MKTEIEVKQKVKIQEEHEQTETHATKAENKEGSHSVREACDVVHQFHKTNIGENQVFNVVYMRGVIQ